MRNLGDDCFCRFSWCCLEAVHFFLLLERSSYCSRRAGFSLTLWGSIPLVPDTDRNCMELSFRPSYMASLRNIVRFRRLSQFVRTAASRANPPSPYPAVRCRFALISNYSQLLFELYLLAALYVTACMRPTPIVIVPTSGRISLKPEFRCFVTSMKNWWY